MYLQQAVNIYQIGQKKLSTRRQQRSALNAFVNVVGADCPVDKLKSSHFVEHRQAIQNQLKGSTFIAYSRTLEKFWVWIASQKPNQLLNPRRYMTPVKQSAVISEHDLARLLEVTKTHPRNHAMIHLMADCGLFADAVIQVQVEDFNLEKRMVFAQDEYGIRRRMFFSEATQAALQAWFTIHPSGSGYLFCQRSGGEQLQRHAVYQVVRRAAATVGIESISLEGFYERRNSQFQFARQQVEQLENQ